MSEALIRVVGPNFVAGFVVQDGRVVAAAPILRRWLMGKSVEAAQAALRSKGLPAFHVREHP